MNNQNELCIFLFILTLKLIKRLRRTARGLPNGIGWLKRDREMPTVEDGTDRFNRILEDIRRGVHRLPKSVVYLLVPGLFSNHAPLYFVNTKTKFTEMGLDCHIAKIRSESSVKENARDIKKYIEQLHSESKKKVIVLGHSKGGLDAAAALSLYWSELKDKVVGLVFAQSPYGGNPIASDILREEDLGDVNSIKLMETISKFFKGKIQALEDLTYDSRKKFLKNHPLPRELPTVSFCTEARTGPTLLAKSSYVAHAELPFTKDRVLLPLSKIMTICAFFLRRRYHEKSDGLVTCCDAEVPGSVVVKPKRKLDHAWFVLSSLNETPLEAEADADAAQYCEALLTLLVEEETKRKVAEVAEIDERYEWGELSF